MLDLLVFYPLMFYFGWKSREWLVSPFGNALFVIELLGLAAVASIRIYYLHVIVLRPAYLAREVQRFSSFNKYTHLALMGVLMVFSVSLMSAHLAFSCLIATFAVAGTFAVLIVEPLIDKTAFSDI